MMALWNGHPDMTRLEVETYLNRKKHLALTTVLSMLTRLEKKKFVSVKKDGRTNLYNPLVTREAYQQQESRSVLEKTVWKFPEKFCGVPVSERGNRQGRAGRNGGVSAEVEKKEE